jgi:Lipopolysaccharide kinase (Kdo/WaaP) family
MVGQTHRCLDNSRLEENAMKAATTIEDEQGFVSVNDLRIGTGYRDLLARNAIDTLDSLFDPGLGEPLGKLGLEEWRERLRVQLDDEGTTRTFYLKRFTDPTPRARRDVKRAGCGAKSVAGVEWTWMRQLAEIGIACAEPVAFGEELTGGRERRSAVLMAEVPGRSLERWAAKWTADDREKMLGVLGPLAEMVAKLHRASLVHRDLYLSHVFFDDEGAVGQRLHLIDLQRVFAPKTMMRRWIVKDLAALSYSTPEHVASLRDRVRWLKRYLGVGRLDANARRLLYRVVGKTERIARHDAKRKLR